MNKYAFTVDKTFEEKLAKVDFNNIEKGVIKI